MYALLIIYAWDMCDLNQDPASNDLDPRIVADGWTAVGIISGRDNVLATAPSARQGIPPQHAGLRQSMIRPGADFRRYGYLAVNATGDTYVAVIRGTDGAEEWITRIPRNGWSLQETIMPRYVEMGARFVLGGHDAAFMAAGAAQRTGFLRKLFRCIRRPRISAFTTWVSTSWGLTLPTCCRR